MTDPERARAGRAATPLRSSSSSRTSSAASRTRPTSRRPRTTAGALSVAHVDLDVARRARGAGRVRLRDRDRRGAVGGELAVVRRAALRLPRRARRLRPAHAGAHRRRDGRRRRQARLRAHAADARAAHPPREGDVEHHDEPDAARARRARDALVARAGGAARGGGDLPRARAVRARARPARARVRRAVVQGGRVPHADPGARGDPPRARARRASRATRSGATTRAWTTCCSSRSPRRARVEDVDRLAEVLEEVCA